MAEDEQLFDLHADSGETTNVLADHPEVARECAVRVQQEHMKREKRRAALDDGTIRKLHEMGYL